MMLHVYCVVSGGIPIFYRFSGKGKTLSFSELAPLNGIQVFGKVHSVVFKSTAGKDFNVHWKNFTDKVSLILISKQSVCGNGELVLNSIFDAMVLTVGIDELTNVKHVDRLKKEIRPSFSLIDGILKSVDEFSESCDHVRLLSLTQMIPSVNSNILQEKLDEWSDSICSLFCCLIVDKKLVVATSAWWELTSVERSLLLSIVVINSNYTTIDIPVFLPVKSPTTAFRLVSSRLMTNIWVSALCGPAPSIMDFEQSSALCWSSIMEILNEISTSIPPIIPEHLNIQNGILGSLLINYEVGNYALLGTVADDKYHFDTLRIFYYQNVRELLDQSEKNQDHKIRETYWYSENYKLYAVVSKPYTLCLMTSSVVPTPSARSISKDILAVIINHKLLC